MSLVSGPLPVALVVLSVLAVLALVPWEQRSRWRVLAVSLPLAAVLTAGVVALVRGLDLVPATVPTSVLWWSGGIVLTVVLAAVGWRRLHRRRWLTPVATVLAVLCVAAAANTAFGYFPTVRSLLGPPTDVTGTRALGLDRLHHLHLDHGEVVQLAVPGRVSHFAARDAYVWLPPAYLADPQVSLPVLELLGGTPSDTVDWLRGGDADATADAYARTHHGFAPLVVMPDVNGSTTGDTECVDSHRGAAETYLTVDVPAFMRARFGAATGPASLAVAGLSEGGTCAVVLALRHPQEYRAFGDFSGLAAPTVTEYVDPALTTHVLFGGSAQRYAEHDPATMLRTHRYPGLAGWFEVGADDHPALRAQQVLAPLARGAGVDVGERVVPGLAHSFTLWAQALRDALPFLAAPLVTDRAV